MESLKERLDRLSEVRHIAHNCEDMLDGEYNEMVEGYERFKEVNDSFYETKQQLKNLVSVIGNTLRQYPLDELDEIEKEEL